MKILIVTPYFYPHIGGVEVYAHHIAMGLKALGWDVVVVTSGTKGKATELKIVDSLRVYSLKPTLVISNTPLGSRWSSELKNIIAVEKPDIINGHTPVPFMADVAARASGSVPFVLTYHNDVEKDGFVYKLIIKLLYRLLISNTLHRSTKIIATSEFYVRQSKYLHRYKQKISIVPPGVDVTYFHPQVSSADLRSKYRGKRVVLFVGSINKSQQYKGLQVLIEAFALLHAERPDTVLVIVGQGDGTALYTALAHKAGVAQYIDFVGYVDHRHLASYYKRASVMAMPSTNNTEGFGMVFMEASAVGVPVIGTRVGGIASAVKDNETGLLVAPRSVTELHTALRTILDDHALAKRLGRTGALRAAKEFNWGLLAKRTDRILKNVIQ